MAQFWLPGDSDFALAMREPNLLVPGKKPQGHVKIDWTKPLTRNLYRDILFNRPIAVDTVSGTVYPKGTGAPEIKQTDKGLALYSSGPGSKDYIDLVSAADFLGFSSNNTNPLSFETLVRVHSYSTRGVIFRFGNASGNPSINLLVEGSQWRFAVSSYASDYAYSTAYTAGAWAHVVCVYDGTYSRIYVNGAAGTEAFDSTVEFDGAEHYLGGGFVAFNREAECDIAYFRYWKNRALSQTEAERLYRDNYRQIYSANDAPFLISVPAGGGVTLAVQSAAHSHSAESPSLVQAHTLTPVDALHSHAAESPSLMQANALNPSDSAHDHSAEQPSLSSASIIAAADALHGHTAEQPSVIQAHVLAVVSATHAHTADNVTLTVGGTLAPDDALHGHIVDAPTLTQAGVLAPADALHANTAEQPALVQANSLSPDDATHGHSAGQPMIDLSVFVSAANSTHGHAADSPTLTQANLLAVADAVHAHLADSPALSQHITVVASDALHAHLAASPNVVIGTLPLMSGRVYLSRATLRVYRPVKRLNS